MLESMFAKPQAPAIVTGAKTIVVDGKSYFLVAAWKHSPGRVIPWRTFMKGELMRSWTDDPVLYPVIEDNLIVNGAADWLHINTTPGWVTAYGEWQRQATFDPSRTDFSTHHVETPLGERTVYSGDLAWSRTPTKDSPFTYWTTPNNRGDCGGAYAVGKNPICSFAWQFSDLLWAHTDTTSWKFLYVGEMPGLRAR